MHLYFMQYLEKKIVRINKILMKVLENILFFLFAVLIVITAVNVICRYLLRNPLFWVTEMACYILVYLIFFGAALALYKGEHVGINTEGIKMPKLWRVVFEKVSIILNYLFIAFLIIFGTAVSYENRGSYTGSLPIAMGVVYLAAPVSGIIMLLLYTEHILIKKKDK